MSRFADPDAESDVRGRPRTIIGRMTERGQPIDVPLACPFVAFEDERDERADRPDPRHRCYAENPPSPLSRTHQEAYCLSPTFAGCPIFREWARREAARVKAGGAPEEPPLRQRDEAAEREAALGWAADVAGQDAARPPRRPTFGQAPPPEQPPGDERRAVPELPPRPVHQGSWSQPPPWLTDRGGAPGSGAPGSGAPFGSLPGGPPQAIGDEGLDRLVSRRDEPWRTYPPADGTRGPAEGPGSLGRPPDERPPQRPSDPSQGLAGSIADESAAALSSRLAAIGLTQPDAVRPALPQPMPTEDDRYQDPARLSAATGESPAIRRLPPPDQEPLGVAAVREPPRSAGALSRILRWNRPPAVSETRSRQQQQPPPQPRRVQQPPWERPQRYEAYPTIRRRIGLPGIPRVLLGAVALAVAAALLFFVPPMFLGTPAGSGDEASPSTPASSASARPASSPTRAPGPTPRVYVVRAGDTLSRIAQRFGITVDEILAANPNIKNPNQIQVNDRITIPAPQPSELVEPSEEATEEPEAT